MVSRSNLEHGGTQNSYATTNKCDFNFGENCCCNIVISFSVGRVIIYSYLHPRPLIIYNHVRKVRDQEIVLFLALN